MEAPDGPPSNADQNPGPRTPGGKLAVVNLHGSFADHHPSGIEAETLTIDSILGTLGPKLSAASNRCVSWWTASRARL